MKIQAGIFALLLLGGCIGSAPKAPQNWAVELWRVNEAGDAHADVAATPRRFGVVRVSQVSVRAPYDGAKLAVMRPDGSLAFDSFNAFAGAPALMLRGAVQDTVEASGLFERVIPANSSASAELTLEATVTRMALDCRREGMRDATIEITLLLARGREIVAISHADGKAATADGDYSAAFSRALANAVGSALGGLGQGS